MFNLHISCHFIHVLLQMHNFELSRGMGFPTLCYMRPAKDQISLRLRTVWSEPLLFLEYSMNVKLLTEYNLKFLSLKGGCTCSSESTLVKIAHCWKSHVTAQFIIVFII